MSKLQLNLIQQKSFCHMLIQLHGYYNNLNYYLIIISHKYFCNLKYKHSFQDSYLQFPYFLNSDTYFLDFIHQFYQKEIIKFIQKYFKFFLMLFYLQFFLILIFPIYIHYFYFYHYVILLMFVYLFSQMSKFKNLKNLNLKKNNQIIFLKVLEDMFIFFL